MANLQTNTEAFDHGQYTDDGAGLLVTADVAAAPVSWGPSAGMADRIEDTSSGFLTVLNCGFISKSAGDTSVYFFSGLVLKDSNTARCPEFQTRFVGGVTTNVGFSVNTQTGESAGPGGFLRSVAGQFRRD